METRLYDKLNSVGSSVALDGIPLEKENKRFGIEAMLLLLLEGGSPILLGDSKNTVRGHCLDIPRFEESLKHKTTFEVQGI